MWALFKDGKQVSKAHSSQDAVFTEALERGAMIQIGWHYSLGRGYDILEVEDAATRERRAAALAELAELDAPLIAEEG